MHRQASEGHTCRKCIQYWSYHIWNAEFNPALCVVQILDNLKNLNSERPVFYLMLVLTSLQCRERVARTLQNVPCNLTTHHHQIGIILERQILGSYRS